MYICVCFCVCVCLCVYIYIYICMYTVDNVMNNRIQALQHR